MSQAVDGFEALVELPEFDFHFNLLFHVVCDFFRHELSAAAQVRNHVVEYFWVSVDVDFGLLRTRLNVVESLTK